MLLGAVLERFAESTPMCVGVQVLLESALAPEALDELFHEVAGRQYERKLLFSTCVDLMGMVVSRTHKSVNAAYRDLASEVGASLKALYDKISRIEPATSGALVRHVAGRLEPIIREMKGGSAPLLRGYRVRILDGNHLTKTQRRIKALRDVAAGPLPGQSLAVLDPEFGLIVDLVCWEDGHSQERSFAGRAIAAARKGDLWIADRNFCTTNILFGVDSRSAKFLVRQHASTLTYDEPEPPREVGRCETGMLFEQKLTLQGPDGASMKVRRITVQLDKPTREGETEVHLLTTLSAREAAAKRVAQLYLERWTIENVFQTLTTVLKCEVNTLGYPKAALFAFAVAAAAFNVYATLRASLRAVHGEEKGDAQISDYYIADEISGTYRGMMVAVPDSQWKRFHKADAATLAELLLDLARRARLERYRKSPRGPKKPKPRRIRFAKSKHIATSRLLAAEKARKKTPSKG